MGIQNNTSGLRDILATVNALPNAGGTGGIVPAGTKQIAANGTYDVTNYASAEVDVPSKEPVTKELSVAANGTYTPETGVDGYHKVVVNVPTGGSSGGDGVDAMLDGSVTGISSNVETVTDHACRGQKNLTTANLPNVNSIGLYSFQDCSSLVSVNAPNVVKVGSSAFYNCKSLQAVCFPKATSLGSTIFGGCSSLAKVDVDKVLTFPSGAFNGCSSLVALIIRRTDATPTLYNNAVLSPTPIASGTGYIYVPRSRVDKYKAATNWSTHAAQIRAIEDYPEITGG